MEKIKNEWRLIIFTAVITGVFGFVGQIFYAQWGKADAAVTQAEFKVLERKMIDTEKALLVKLEEKASTTYVKEAFIQHEIKEQILLQNITNVISLSQEKQEALLRTQQESQEALLRAQGEAFEAVVSSIHSRLGRLEEKVDNKLTN